MPFMKVLVLRVRFRHSNCEEKEGFMTHTSTQDPKLTAQLAELICSLDYRSLPPEVIKKAKDYIIDQFGIPWMINCEKTA